MKAFVLTKPSSQQGYACAIGYSPDLQGLLNIKHVIPNFDISQRRSSAIGWADKPGADVCTWSGVACGRNGSVIHLDFDDFLVLTGAEHRP